MIGVSCALWEVYIQLMYNTPLLSHLVETALGPMVSCGEGRGHWQRTSSLLAQMCGLYHTGGLLPCPQAIKQLFAL